MPIFRNDPRAWRHKDMNSDQKFDKEKNKKISGLAVFWLVVALFYIIDTAVFLKGYNTFFWCYKTENELASQKKKLGI